MPKKSDSKFKLLVVDDDPLVHQSLALAVPDQWQITTATALSHVPDTKFDAAMIDMHLTENSQEPEGPQIIAELSRKDCHLEIVAMSGNLNRAIMEESLRAGASRFLAKPLTLDELLLTLEKIEAYLLLERARSHPHQQQNLWIGSSKESKDILQKIAALKGEMGCILIEGESGTGKEVIAQTLHSQEPKGRPIISVNLAAISENLFESEFFGHTKGAFTGADQSKMGLLEAAHGGDLFLDEIEAMPLQHQAKLLRFLENGEVRRVGSQKNIHCSVRVIAATNRCLNKMVQNEEFREDLLWRISGQKIKVPPLKNRKEDIQELAKYFLQNQRPKHNKILADDALMAMQSHSWPGNVRELKRVCEQLGIHTPLPIIRQEDVESCIGIKTTPATKTKTFSQVSLSNGLAAHLKEYEAQMIRQVLQETSDVDTAARVLQVSKSNLYKKIKDFKIEL